MKRVHGLCIGAAVAMIAAGAGLGCSSSSSGGSTTEGTDSGTSGLDSSVADTGTAADTGSTTGDSGSSEGGEGGPVTFAEVWTTVIDVHCVGCHSPPVGDAGAKGGFGIGHLDMSSADAGYANLVNVPAQGTESFSDAGTCGALAEAGAAGSIRVVPGDAGASLLYLKVNGFNVPPPCGSPMPITGEIAADAGGQAPVVQEIQTWINEGAHP